MRGSVTGNQPRVFVEVGQRFERLTVIRLDIKLGVSASKPAGWRAAICLCDCGTEALVKLSDLTRGKKRSCGCLKREAAWLAEARHDWPTVHGFAAHPLYDTWCSMMSRCRDQRNTAYPRYGGRGIQVCDRWHDAAVFIADIEAGIGPRPEGKFASGKPLYSLDRVNNDGNYEPGNVRWATATQQQNNKGQRSECSEGGCSKVTKARGLCKRHYQVWWRRNRAQAA